MLSGTPRTWLNCFVDVCRFPHNAFFTEKLISRFQIKIPKNSDVKARIRNHEFLLEVKLLNYYVWFSECLLVDSRLSECSSDKSFYDCVICSCWRTHPLYPTILFTRQTVSSKVNGCNKNHKHKPTHDIRDKVPLRVQFVRQTLKLNAALGNCNRSPGSFLIGTRTTLLLYVKCK